MGVGMEEIIGNENNGRDEDGAIKGKGKRREEKNGREEGE